MSELTLSLTQEEFERITSALDDDRETAFTAILGETRNQKGRLEALSLRELVSVPAHAYVERDRQQLIISSSGFMPTFGEAAKLGASAAFIHTHPGGQAIQSKRDEIVDAKLAQVVLTRTKGHRYMSLIAAGTSKAPRLIGRLVSPDGTKQNITRFRIIGSQLRVLVNDSTAPIGAVRFEPFDRQVRAFGKAGQSVLASLRVGIAGAGGTGSAVCEQLVRLGIGHITIVDDDVVTESNVSRIFGSTVKDIGKPKVQVVARYSNAIRRTKTVAPIIGRVTQQSVARHLTNCDVIFGCTDDQLGRSVLSRMAYWYLISFIDMGVLIASKGASIAEVYGRVTVVHPGTACLLCRDRIQPEVIRSESLPRDERARLAAEGYVQGLGEPDPSVVTYTSLIASVATSEMLRRLFSRDAGAHGDEYILRIDQNSLRTNTVRPRHGHYCANRSDWGAADSEPFLGQLWT